MQEFKSLKLLDRFKKVLISLGIDYQILRKILQVKFTLDTRRITITSRGQKNDTNTNMFNRTLMYYGFFGLFLAVFPFIGHLFMSVSLFYGVIMFFLVTILISDFSEVLLDLKDSVIIGTKPVGESTLNMAKYIHVVTYLTLIAGALAGPGIIAFGIKYSILVSIMMIIQLILICGLTVIFATLIYALLLKFFDGEKLRDIINIFQIVLATVTAFGYQVFARIFRFIDLDVVFTLKWWTYLMPPIWFSSQVEVLLGIDDSKDMRTLALCGITIVVTAIILHIKVISKVFERNINKLNHASTSNKNMPKGMKPLSHKLMHNFCSSSTERAYFRFAQNMYKNDRGIKLRVYPTVALAIFFPPIIVVFTFLDTGNLESFIRMFSETRMVLFTYITGLMMISIYPMVHYTDSYKGKWVIRALPIDSYEDILKGVNKAFILHFLLPVFIMIMILALPLVGNYRVLDLILMAVIPLNAFLLMVKINAKELPFMKAYNPKDANKGTFFVNLGVMGVFVLIHYLIYYNLIFKAGYLFIHIGILIYAWNTAHKIKKSDLENMEVL